MTQDTYAQFGAAPGPDAEEYEECGQCEGTGSTDAMGYEEECPVCNGTGRLPLC